MSAAALDRVRKLLALAAGTSHVEEARTAALQAVRLMAAHGFVVAAPAAAAPPPTTADAKPRRRPRRVRAERCAVCGRAIDPLRGDVGLPLRGGRHAHATCYVGRAAGAAVARGVGRRLGIL